MLNTFPQFLPRLVVKEFLEVSLCHFPTRYEHSERMRWGKKRKERTSKPEASGTTQLNTNSKELQ